MVERVTPSRSIWAIFAPEAFQAGIVPNSRPVRTERLKAKPRTSRSTRVSSSLGRSTGHREIGVIAQDVETVFPELVTEWGDDNYKAVDYGRFAGVFIEAIKELKVENELLKQRIEELETILQK